MSPATLRWMASGFFLFSLVFATPVAQRWSPLIVSAGFLVLAIRPPARHGYALPVGFAAVWCAAFASPVDVTFRDVPGPPRLVPFVCGLPRPEAIESAQRGELVLGSDIVSGLEPRWVLVW